IGLMLQQTVAENLTLASLRKLSGGTRRSVEHEIQAAERIRRELQIKTESLETTVRTLSGGNQQKVVLGKWLLTSPRVLLLDEPTRGIDVGAKQEIYARIAALAEQGLAIVVVSSELEEIVGMADRVVVMRE